MATSLDTWYGKSCVIVHAGLRLEQRAHNVSAFAVERSDRHAVQKLERCVPTLALCLFAVMRRQVGLYACKGQEHWHHLVAREGNATLMIANSSTGDEDALPPLHFQRPLQFGSWCLLVACKIYSTSATNSALEESTRFLTQAIRA